MPVTLELDKIDGAEFEETLDRKRIVRIGHARGLPDDVPHSVLLQALTAAGMPTMGSVHPADSTVILTSRKVRNLPATDQARVELVYETPDPNFGGGGGGASFVIEDDSEMQFEQSAVDGKNLPIEVRPPGPVVSTYERKRLIVPRYLPVRAITLKASLAGDNPLLATLRAAHGKVNAGSWRGLPEGYWLFRGLHTSTKNLGRTYSVVCRVISRVKKSWRELGFYPDHNGMPYKETSAGDVTALATGYSWGQEEKDGVTGVGNYETTAFSPLFGIS